MKKLMFAVAAITAGVAMADVTSANVVGYSQPATTKQSVSWTPMFIPVEGMKMLEGKPVYQLKDFSAFGMLDMGDSIQFLDPYDAHTYLQVVYLDEETYGTDLEGWWDINGDFMSEEFRKDEEYFAYGTSFLAAFMGGGEVTMKYSGAVIKDSKTFSFNAEGTDQSVFFGNYLPKDLLLEDITATGMLDMGDSIQFLDADDAHTYLQVVYLDEETYGSDLKGWWDINGDFMSEEFKKDKEPVPAGQGFLAAFMGGGEISVTFPNAY